MNLQHRINKFSNRYRRIGRRIKELEADKAHEVIAASSHKRDPNLGPIMADINRLNDRKRELEAV